MRLTFMSIWLISVCLIVVQAIWVTSKAPPTNQHVLSSAMLAGFVLATVISNIVYSLKCVYGWIPKCMLPQSITDLRQDTAAVEKVRANINIMKVEQH